MTVVCGALVPVITVTICATATRFAAWTEGTLIIFTGPNRTRVIVIAIQGTFTAIWHGYKEAKTA